MIPLLYVPLHNNLSTIALNVARNPGATGEFLTTIAVHSDVANIATIINNLDDANRHAVCTFASGLLKRSGYAITPSAAANILAALIYNVTDQTLIDALTHLTRNDRTSATAFARTLVLLLEGPDQ